jgi:prophage regulatory protein
MSAHPRELIRLAEVKRRTGLPTSTLYKEIAEGRFPRQVPIGARAVGWCSDEVETWIQSRVSKRKDEWQSLGEVAARVAARSGRK